MVKTVYHYFQISFGDGTLVIIFSVVGSIIILALACRIHSLQNFIFRL